MNFYLKYRPQKVSELDLARVRQTLTETLAAKSRPHAWLLAGPKGTGKTSSARIIAKAVNCQAGKKPAVEPCNRCAACTAITKGTSLDVFEIDAASNRGIDDIRDLKDKIKLAPTGLLYKVYIIDEVHMLTKEAFNALLKTLEEPPKHAVFILATTEPEKLPATVVSRCLVVKFNKAASAELERSLKRVIKAENLRLNEPDIAKIAAAADGSFRDAVKTLEQLAATGKKISAARVSALLESGLTSGRLDEWLTLVYEGQTLAALKWLQSAWDEGVGPKQLALSALERLRQTLLRRSGVETAGEDIAAIKDIERLKQLARRFLTAAADIKTAVIDTLPIELLVVEQGQAGSAAAPATSTSEVKEVPTSEVQKAGQVEILSKWPQVLEAVRPLNHSLEALLKATEPVGFSDGFLQIKVFYQFHKDRLEEERYRALVEQTAAKVLVTQVKIKYFLADRIAAAELVPTTDEDIIKTAEEVFGVGGD